tara:strand:+ start:1356 stop:1793 length:438 start_codon:yes stop_codon:yes gene_type:complete
MQGFIVNDNSPTNIVGYNLAKAVLLHEDSDQDVYSKAMPNSCYLSHLDLQLDQTGSALHELVSCFITWDVEGNDPMTSESVGNNVVAGLTDTSLALASIGLDVWVTRPAGQTTTGKVYLHVRGDKADGRFTVAKARLHWATRETI